jgi:hypothetical protein
MITELFWVERIIQTNQVSSSYLMAQSISISRGHSPRMLLRSRYAVAEVGWFPQNNL